MKKNSDSRFDPPGLSKREAAVLRGALIKYAKDCDARFQDAANPQNAYNAAADAAAARELAERIVRTEQAVGRPVQNSTLRAVRSEPGQLQSNTAGRAGPVARLR
jgi:hypothetical protein